MGAPVRIALRVARVAALAALAAGAGAAPYVYVANEASGDVTVVDAARASVAATVRVGTGPYGIAASQAGRRVYVANRISNDVTVVDGATNTVVATVPVGQTPTGIAVDPSGTRVYVANFYDNALSVIDVATSAIVATVRIGARPRGVAVSADGTRVIVTTASPAGYAIVDAERRVVASRFVADPLRGATYGVAASPDGIRFFYAFHRVESWTGGLPPPCVVPPPCPPPEPLATGLVMIADVRDDEPLAGVAVDQVPFGIAVSPDGKRVYVTSPGAGTVSVVDPARRIVVARAQAGVSPQGVSVDPDGATLYVIDGASNALLVLDALTLERRGAIPSGASPVSLGSFAGPPRGPLAVEYFHAGYGHYFMSADHGELAALDSGTIAGWTRTGASFRVAPLGAPATAGVCRFWSGQSFAPKSSHFYTTSAAECASVKENHDWTFEGEDFGMTLPAPDGGCAPDSLALYRLFNNGLTGAPNHRYTTSLATRADMRSRGWTPEGAGTLGVIGCVAAP